MDFRELAAKEAAAFVQRAVKRSADASGKQLDDLRAALDAASKAIAAASLSPRDDQEAAEFATRLTKVASESAAHAAKLAADEAQKQTNTVRAELDAALKQLDAAVKHKEAAATSLRDAQAQLESARAEVKTAKDRSETISRQLGEARKFSEKLEIAKTELTAALDDMAKARAAAEAALHDARAKHEATRAELTLAAKNLEKMAAEKAKAEDAANAAHSASEASEAKLAAVTDLFKQSGARVKALEREKQDYEKAIQDLQAKAKSGSAAPMQPSALPVLDALIAGFHGLGTAKSVNDVLTTLVAQLAKQFPRVALFRVKKSHLQGEQQVGFDLKTDIAKVVMPLGMDSLLAHAASSGRVERLKGNELKEGGAPFSGSPRHALALPIMIGSEALAIIYVDDSGAAPDLNRDMELDARYAEAMQQHAAALIARLTNELKAMTELRAYATSLLHELEQMHDADVQSGLAGDELQARLKGNVDYARDVYGARVAHESPDAAPFFEDELSIMIASQNGSPFGRDLAAVAGRSTAAAAARTAS